MRSFVLLLATIACLSFGRLALGIGPLAADARGLADHVGNAWRAPQPQKHEALTRVAPPLIHVAPAPVSGRLPAVPPGVLDLPQRARVVTFERGVAQKCSASGHEQVRVRRRVPRMESGDPPRV